MARATRNARLENREARRKLRARNEPYWQPIDKGLSLGYRKGEKGGTWYLRRRENDRYQIEQIAIADDHQDSDGASVRNYFDAQALARSVAASRAKGDSGTSHLTVADAAARYLDWYEQHRKAFTETKATVEAHILPAFGPRLLSELTTTEIKAWRDKLASKPARVRSGIGKKQQFRPKPEDDNGKRARKSSANRILTVLKAMLNKAFEDELVSDDLAWRRVRPFENADEPATRYLTLAEATRLINACRRDLRQLVKAALFSGARYSELTRLLVADVNTDTATIYIQPSKSGKGRHIPLSADGLDFVRAEIAGKEKAEAVFTKEDGAAWGKNHHVRLLKLACSRAKLAADFGFHELRHTYASLLAQAGADLLTISKLLGHADTRITSRHYAHLCDRTLANAVNTLLPSFGHEPENRIRAIA